ncbi:cytochrome P450 [Hyalangium sp.]|uniref:cytochrome P450 n=1 Tax=Hyalangium sp. TaxID=2028555 RepID=UPI002D46FC37|nr:cytochrome P450 [Hyalangium sp.]HYH99188.1 cytochrome P450 [Hyalangium sp.]
MATPPEETPFVHEMRTRCHAEGSVLWVRDGELGVFDPEAAQKIHALNFSDLTLPDKLADLLRGRRGSPVSWKEVRTAWLSQLRRLSDAEAVARLAARMSELLEERLDRPLDWVWVAQEVCSQALVPTVVTGLKPTDVSRVLRDQTLKLTQLLAIGPGRDTLWQELRAIWIQVGAGSAVRRELRGRATGRRPRQLDLADPIVELLPVLGMDRAVDAVTAVLTAIAGPPGAAATCLLYELTRRPEWAQRLARELSPLKLEDFYSAPTRVAPVTHRFVKETLRMWGPPMFMTRLARTDIQLEQASLKTGQRYYVSPYLVHHAPEHWKDPDAFDPDRWLADAPHGPCSGASYVPFGWAPTTCIGAGLGTAQLMLLCHLMCTRYRLQLSAPEEVRMMLANVALPLGFTGTLTRR